MGEFFKKHKKTLIILGLILVLGAFLRFYKLGENSFVADEFLDINSSYAYFKTHTWTNWDFNFDRVNEDNVFAPRDERAWAYKWQVAEVFRFVAPTEGAARSISVIWGIITIGIMYYAGWYFSKKKAVGLLSAFLFAVSVAGITFDRKLRMYAMFFPIFLLFSIALFRFFEETYKGSNVLVKKISDRFGVNVIWFLPMLLLAILSLHLHDLTANIAAIFGIYVLAQMFFLIKKGKTIVNKYSITVVGAAIAVALVWAIVPELFGKYLAGIKFFQDNYSYFSIVTDDYSHILIALAVLVFGIYFGYSKLKLKKETIWLAVSFMVPLLMAIFLWRRNAGAQYIFFAQSFEIILAAIGIYGLAKFFASSMPEYGKKAYTATIIILLLLLPNYGYFFQQNNAYHQTSKADNPNYRSIFGYVKKKKSPDDVIITRNFRNYYLSGQKMTVFDFGGELSNQKLPMEAVYSVVRAHPRGWIVLSDNDERYISNEAMQYIEQNMQRINDIAVRGNVMVYRWSK